MSRSRRRPNKARKPRPNNDNFWGDTPDHTGAAGQIRPTTDPAALPRSLGEPPLTPDTAALHHLAVVYEEAVRAATALAAANGLLQDDEPD
jgi:hypothetical protein